MAQRETDPVRPPVYEIRVQGHLGSALTDWFAGLSTTLEDGGDTLLTGALVDQAELHGVLKRVRDLGVTLVSVTLLDPGPPPQPKQEGN